MSSAWTPDRARAALRWAGFVDEPPHERFSRGEDWVTYNVIDADPEIVGQLVLDEWRPRAAAEMFA